VSVRR